MSTGRIPATLALEAAELFLANVSGCYQRAEIAGSLRRWISAGCEPHNRTIGDVEIVAIPHVEERLGELDLFGVPTSHATVNLLWERIDQIGQGEDAPYGPWIVTDKNGRQSRRWGEKYRKVALPLPGDERDLLIPCDLFLTTPTSWGAQFAIRTGPAEWSRALVMQTSQGGLCPPGIRFESGQVWRDGEPVAVPEERDLFDLLGIGWLDPYERTPEAARPRRFAA